MEPFEGGPGEPTKDKPPSNLASRTKVMEVAAIVTAVFILALVIVGGGGLLMLDLGWRSLATWAVLVSPLLLLNGVLLRKINRNRYASLDKRMSKVGVVLVTIGTVGLSLLAATISFMYCSYEVSKAWAHV